MTSLIWATLWPHSLLPHKLKAAVRSFSLFFFFSFYKFSSPIEISERLWIIISPPKSRGGRHDLNLNLHVPCQQQTNLSRSFWGRRALFLHIRAILRCSCLHKQLLTYIRSLPANPRRYFGFSQTQSAERKGNVMRRRRGGGSHGEHRPAHTCLPIQAKIVYVRGRQPRANPRLRLFPVWQGGRWSSRMRSAHSALCTALTQSFKW